MKFNSHKLENKTYFNKIIYFITIATFVLSNICYLIKLKLFVKKEGENILMCCEHFDLRFDKISYLYL